MQRQTTILGDQSRHELRPWLEVGENGEPTLTEGQKLEVPIVLTNRGRWPAVSMNSFFHVDVIENGKAPNFDELNKTPDKQGTAYFSGVFFPDRRGKIRVQRVASLTHGEALELKSGKAWLATYGEVTYRDAFGISHWTRFCAWRGNSSETAATCVSYNAVDTN